MADPEFTDKNTEALRELNDFLAADDRVTFSLVPVGDGMALCTVLGRGAGAGCHAVRNVPM